LRKIIVYGSINIDMVVSTPRMPDEGETINGSGFYKTFGGKGANQAVAAARLGGDVQMLGCVGDDFFGSEAMTELKKNNISTKYVKQVKDVSTGVAIIIREDVNNRIIIDKGSNEHLTLQQIKKYRSDNNNHNEIFVTQLENDIDNTMRALEYAKSRGMLTILNPAPATKIPSDSFENIDILVLNQSETKILIGIYPTTVDDCKSAFSEFSSLGINKVVITLGDKGSCIFNNNKFLYIEAESVDVVDTVGAGDSYIGGLAYMLSKNVDLFKAARFAGKVASLSIMKEGAQSSMPVLEEISNFNF